VCSVANGTTSTHLVADTAAYIQGVTLNTGPGLEAIAAKRLILSQSAQWFGLMSSPGVLAGMLLTLSFSMAGHALLRMGVIRRVATAGIARDELFRHHLLGSPARVPIEPALHWTTSEVVPESR
jgi:hypothetical protein